MTRSERIDQDLKDAWDALSQCTSSAALKASSSGIPPIVKALRSLTAAVESLVVEVKEQKENA